MRYRKVEDGYLVVLSRGEKIMGSLATLAGEEKIGAASITGLGAVMNTELGFYHLSRKEYDRKRFPAEAELVNLTGNIAWLGDKPVVHCHLTLGDEEFHAHCGHLFEAECAVTVEIFVSTRKTRLERRFNDEIGLNLQVV